MTHVAKSVGLAVRDGHGGAPASGARTAREEEAGRGRDQPERADHAGHVLQRADREQQGEPAEHDAHHAHPAGVGAVPERAHGDGEGGQAGAAPQPRDGADPVREERRGLRHDRVGVLGAEDELGGQARAEQLGDRHEQQPVGGDARQQAVRPAAGAPGRAAARPRRR